MIKRLLGIFIIFLATTAQIYLPVILRGHDQPQSAKRGVLMPSEHAIESDMALLRLSWYYNNQPSPYPGFTAQFVPSLYGPANIFDTWYLNTAIANAQSGWIIGYDEPNLHGVTPHAGAVGWHKLEQAAPNIKLVSPIVSQHNPGELDPWGNTWLWAMVAEYQKLYGVSPRFDAIGLDSYKHDPDEMMTYIDWQHQMALAYGYNGDVWVVAYAGECWGSPTGNNDIMTQVTPWLEAQPWVMRYGWFTNRITGTEAWGLNHQSCSLIAPGTGELTALGQMWRGW